MTEPNISRITTNAIKKFNVKGATGHLGNIIKDTLNGSKQKINFTQNYTKKSEGNIGKEDTPKERFVWPVCVKCGRTTSDNPAKPRLTPQWWDGQWQCEDCTFKDCFE